MDVDEWIMDQGISPVPRAPLTLTALFNDDKTLNEGAFVIYLQDNAKPHNPLLEAVALMYIEQGEKDKVTEFNSPIMDDIVSYFTKHMEIPMKDGIPYCTYEDDYLHPISQRAIDWIKYYCKDIYVYHTPSFTLPSAVIEDLSTIKKCYDITVYRGMSFGFTNLDKGIAMLDSVNVSMEDEEDKTLTIQSSIPISTSILDNVAQSFGEKGIIGLVLMIEVKKEEVLVDLNLLDNNEYVDDSIYYKGEGEVILLPGKYTFDVVYTREEKKEVLDELLLLHSVLKPYFNGPKVLKAAVSYQEDTLMLLNNTLTVMLLMGNDQLFVRSSSNIMLPLTNGTWKMGQEYKLLSSNGVTFLVDNIQVLLG